MLSRISLVTAILLSKVAYPAQSDLENCVAQQVKQIKFLSGSSEHLFGELPWKTLTSKPVTELISYGIDAIPYLTLYLADTSLTRAYREHGKGWRKQVPVYEYIVYIIYKIAKRGFHYNFGFWQRYGVLEAIALQIEILSWWQENRSKSLLDRKIEDVNGIATGYDTVAIPK